MKWLTFEIQQQPGFRLNLLDLLFITLLILISALLHYFAMPIEMVLLPLYLGLSFFLFCNVFRIGNYLERFWYIPFTLLAAWGISYQQLEIMWWVMLLGIEPLKWILIGIRIKGVNYVGAGYRRITRN